MKTIKVTQTKLHQYSIKSDIEFVGQKETRAFKEVPVVEGKLVLVECEVDKGNWLGYNNNHYTPLIVSETEKIEVGDWVWAQGSLFQAEKGTDDQSVHYISNYDIITRSLCDKVLALPEHFSPKHLQAIVDGKMRDGDTVLVECTNKGECIDGEIVTNLLNGKTYVFNAKLHAQELHIGQSNHYIKLNSSNYITLHKVEEKMYTRAEMELLITQAIKDCELDALDYHEAGKYNNLALWLKENIK